MRRTTSTQGERIVVLALNLLALVIVTWVIVSKPFAPVGGAGLWFYSAALAFLLADLVVEPWYTRPADAFVNAAVVLVAGATASHASFAHITARTFTIGRISILVAAGVIAIAAAVAMLSKPRMGAEPGRVHQLAFGIAGTAGRARVLFGALFAIAAAAAFATDVAALAGLYVFGIVFLEERLLERLLLPVLQRPSAPAVSEGIIERVAEPRTAIASVAEQTRVSVGTVAWQRGDAIGVVTFATEASEAASVEVVLNPGVTVRTGEPLSFSAASPAQPEVLGSVAAGTQLERIVVRASPSRADELGVSEGRLISTNVCGESVLYQVVDAQLGHGSPEAPAASTKLSVTARKLGRWSAAQATFEPVDWIPQPGEVVKLVNVARPAGFDERYIGFVPSSTYGVAFDGQSGITHNTAVFGILGSGKTTLAAELVWRVLAEGTKAVVLDISNQWARHFEELGAAAEQAEFESRVAAAIQPRAATRSVDGEEAGNVALFRRTIKTELGAFLTGNQRLLICNPARFVVTHELGFLRSGQAEVLRALTPAEITSCIAVALLDLVSGEESELARVVLVLEEAHTLAPEWNSVAHEKEKQATTATARAVLQGRKYGLGCLVVTQRTANVTKTILNQCNTIFALRVYDQTGAEFLTHFIGSDYANLLANLDDRHAVVFGRGSSCRSPVIVALNDEAELEAWKEAIASRLEDDRG
jgi:uncharacterized protein